MGVTWSSYTRFQNVYKMLPCQVLTVNGNKQLRMEQYWQPQEETMWRGTLEEHIERWGALLRELS